MDLLVVLGSLGGGGFAGWSLMGWWTRDRTPFVPLLEVGWPGEGIVISGRRVNLDGTVTGPGEL